MNERIMVIPGTLAQVSLINRIKEFNFDVVCVNPDENSPAFKYADICEIGDILDKKFCLEVAKRYSVIAVMSDECDIAMPTIAYISEELGLPTIGSNLTSLYTNKYLMRKFSEEEGFPFPQYTICNNVKEATDFFERLESKKMIMKPLDSNSSRGVFTIYSSEEIEIYFLKTMSFSKVEQAIICEEYIEGTEFTVDGIVINKKHYSLAISRKKHYEYNTNIAYELYFTSSDKDFDYNLLRKQNDLYVEKSKLPFGFTHAEYKYNGKEFVLIEIGARGGGNYISSHIVPRLTGVDNYKILIESVLGKKLDGNTVNIDNKLNRKCAVLRFFDLDRSGGRVVKIEGEQYLRDTPEVILYQFRFEIGDYIYKAQNDSARIGFYIAVAETKDRLDDIITKIDEKVRIDLEENV